MAPFALILIPPTKSARVDAPMTDFANGLPREACDS